MRYQFDHYIYFKKINNGNYAILLLCMDDMLVAGYCMKYIVELKNKLENTFSMKDLDEAKQIIRMGITRNKENHMLK